MIPQRPAHVQAMLMLDNHTTDYDYAINIARNNIKLYSHYDTPASDWWREVRHELQRMKANHMQSDHAYYQAVTGELDAEKET